MSFEKIANGEHLGDILNMKVVGKQIKQKGKERIEVNGKVVVSSRTVKSWNCFVFVEMNEFNEDGQFVRRKTVISSKHHDEFLAINGIDKLRSKIKKQEKETGLKYEPVIKIYVVKRVGDKKVK